MTTNHGQMRELYPAAGETYSYRTGVQGETFTFELESGEEDSAAAITLSIESRQTGEGICRTESGRIYSFAWAWVGQELHLWLEGSLHVFQWAESRRPGGATTANVTGDVLAPMTGAVLEVLVGEGERVERNQAVVIMESMKMELVITASRDGVVGKVAVQPGQQVEQGMKLVELEGEGGE